MTVRPFYLAGAFKKSARTLKINNPFSGESVSEISLACEEDVDLAIERAAACFGTTRTMPSYQRSEVLNQIASALHLRAEEFARMITQENGKPIQASRKEVGRAVAVLSWAAEEAKRVTGEMLSLDLLKGAEGRIGFYRRFPIGPVSAITPFNFPLNLIVHKLAPAIAAGNPILIKPASQTSMTALLLAELIAQSSLIPGAVSVLPCETAVAQKLVTDERIRMLTFTGSAQVGWQLKQRAGKKKVALELGGNAGVIVHQDASFDWAVERCVYGAFLYSGQTCISVQRIYVHQSLYQKFLDSLVERAKQLKSGDPMKEETDLGPLISREAAERVEAWVNEAKSKGAKILCGGRREGSFYQPTILVNTTPEMRINCEEVFGPVVSVQSYGDFQEALHLLNQSRYGLQAGIFTYDLRLIHLAYLLLEVGGIMINEIPTYRIDSMPYGGTKESGLGREGIRYAMEEMMEPKLLMVNTS